MKISEEIKSRKMRKGNKGRKGGTSHCADWTQTKIT